MIRSNDHANMLRLMSSIVCGSQIRSPTLNPRMISTLQTQLPDAIPMISG